MNILINLHTGQMEWTKPEGTFAERVSLNRRRFILEAVHDEMKEMSNEELLKVVTLIQKYKTEKLGGS